MILADTHAWLWWTSSPELLSPSARAALEQTDRIGVSAISCYEAVGLIHRGRVHPDRDPRDWLSEALRIERIEVLDVSGAIAAGAALFPRDRMRDPIDRIIVGTALHHGVPLVTRDEKIRVSGVIETIW